jgi:hypothetical protein
MERMYALASVEQFFRTGRSNKQRIGCCSVSAQHVRVKYVVYVQVKVHFSLGQAGSLIS